MILKILVLNKLSSRHIELLTRINPEIEIITTTLEEAEQHIADTDILVAWGFMHIEKLYAQAKQLK